MTIGQPFNPFGLFNGIFIPEGIAAATTILPGAKLAYGRLLRYAGRDGNCYPAVPKLAKEIGTSERQTQRYLSDLEGRGLIRRNKRFTDKGDRTSNGYEFLWHPLLDGVTSTSPHPGDSDTTPGDSADTTPGDVHVTQRESILRESALNKNSGMSFNDEPPAPDWNDMEAAPAKPKPIKPQPSVEDPVRPWEELSDAERKVIRRHYRNMDRDELWRPYQAELRREEFERVKGA